MAYPALRRVISGSFTITSAGTHYTSFGETLCSLQNSFILYQVRPNMNTQWVDHNMLSIGLYSTTQIRTVAQVSYGAGQTVDYWIFEFRYGVRVQHYYSGASAPSSPITVNPVDRKKAWIIASYTSPDEISYDDGCTNFYFSDDDEVAYSSLGGSDPIHVQFQVIEMDGAKVEHITDSTTTAQATKDVTLARKVNLAHTLLFYSYASATTSTQMNWHHTARMYDEDTVRLEAYSAGAEETFSMFIVESPQFFVQHGEATFSAGNANSVITLREEVWQGSRTVPFLCGGAPGNGGRTSRATNSFYLSECSATNSIDSSTQVTLTRTLTTNAAAIPYQFFEYKEELRIRRKINGGVLFSDNDEVITLDDPVDTEKAFVVCSTAGSNSDPEPNENYFRTYWTSIDSLGFATQLTIRRGSTNSPTNSVFVKYEIVEFESGAWVQHGTASGVLTGTSYDITLPEAVDLSRAFPIVSRETNGTAMSDNDVLKYELTGTTTLNIASNAADNNANFSYYVVQIDKCKVQSITGTLSAFTSLTTDITLGDLVNPERAFLIGSTTISGDSTYPAFPTWRLYDPATVRIERGTTSSYTYNYAIYVVECEDRIMVQRGWTGLGSGTVVDETITKPVVPEWSSYFLGSAEHAYIKSTSDTDNTNDSMVNTEILDEDTIRFGRFGTDTGSYVPWEVVQWQTDHHTTRKHHTTRVIQNSQVSTDEINFPVMLVWTGSASTSNLPEALADLDGTRAPQPDLGDLMITSNPDGTGRLPIDVALSELDNNTANSRITVYISVPNIYAASNVTLHLWWGSYATKYQPAEIGPYGRATVWRNADFSSVFHLQEKWGNALNATTLFDEGVPHNVTQGVVGKYGYCYEFGTDNDEDILISSTNRIEPSTGVEITAWAYANSSWTEPDQRIVRRAYSDSDNGVFDMNRQDDRELQLRITTDTAGYLSSDRGIYFAADAWSWASAGWDATSDAFDARIDSSVAASWSVAGNNLAYSTSTNTDIGGINGRANRSFSRYLQEVRIANVKRSAGWRTTEYTMWNSPQTFALEGTAPEDVHSLLPVTEGVMCHLDISLAASVEKDGSNYLERLYDIGDGKYDIWAESSSLAPLWVGNQYNSLPTMRFDGTDDFLMLMKVYRPYTLIIVLKEDSDATDNDRPSFATKVGYPTSGDMIWHRGETFYIYDNTSIGSWTGWTGGSTYLDQISVNPQSTVYKNQLQQMHLLIADDPNINQFVDQIGRDRELSGRVWDGDICEIIMYDRVITSAERSALETYIIDKWFGTVGVGKYPKGQEFGQKFMQEFGQL